jgi:hypothetical protein
MIYSIHIRHADTRSFIDKPHIEEYVEIIITVTKGVIVMGKRECIDAMDYNKEWKQWRKGMCRRIAKCQYYGMSVKEARDWAEAIVYCLNRDIEPGSTTEELIAEDWHFSTPEERKILAAGIFKKAASLLKTWKVPFNL